MDSLKLESLKNKEEHAQSAIASQEVLEHLAGFIRSKRQGSSTQINSLQHQSTSNFIQTSGNSSYGSHYEANFMNGGAQDDDHPLRKTASMPTMHIPYKATSLSRRRQMERRTTMSPLMKRKSKPKRQLLHSQDSNSTEYSSNPCIIHSSRSNTRSLSQSSSPPPYHMTTDITNSGHKSTICQQSSTPTSASQTIKLSSIFSNRELENLQGNLKNSLYFPPTSHSSNTNLQQAQKNSNNLTQNINNNSNNNSNNGNTQQATVTDKRQQHLKVNEAIRKTVIQRASSKGKIAAGGSLDIEGSPPLNRGSDGVESRHQGTFKDELRQLSLDGADLRTNAAFNKLSSGGSMLNSMFQNRDLQKIRLATTNDAASLRRSQSPSSSISMGLLSNNQTAVNAAHQAVFNNQPQYPILTREARQAMAANSNVKHYSSSSSSTSSLLSQQDSLDESSSQAMDLSSSSEASRHRQQHQHQQIQSALFSHNRSQQITNHLMNTSNQLINPIPGQHYQTVLQDSFNQLQLCQSQEGMKHPFLPSQAQQQTVHQRHVNLRDSSHPPPLVSTSRTATSLDATGNLMTSLPEQFNSSASAQNLISLQDQQHLQNTVNLNSLLVHQRATGQQQSTAHDLNQWLYAYNNIIQPNDPQQISNGNLMAKIYEISEPYKSALLTHLIQQQHQLLNSVVDNSRDELSGQRLHEQEQRSALISRALSSPLLISSDLDAPMPQATQQQDHVMDSTTNQRQQQANIEVFSDRNFERAAESSDIHIHGIVIDSVNPETKESKKSKTFSIGADSNHSLDLTNSSRTTSDDRTKSSSSPKYEIPLNFSYTPVDPKKVSCTFIYNPVFDKNSSTGLIYELEMCNHKCICGNENNHPENSYRILAIWRRLYDKGLMAKCAKIEARKATLDEIQLCHSETYSYYFGKSPYERIKLSQLDLSKLPIEGLTQLECGGQGADIDTAWNEEQTPGVARLAAGCVIEAAINVADGKLMNAFAIVRPPGHHAETQQAMGFCFFNSVAIAARVLISKRGLARVLIVDWDVHHGNGIQKMFYEDKSVMYISLHRHEKGNFFPGTGDMKEIGLASGEGFNWNIAWSREAMGDAEYMAAFRSLVMPIARDFNPSMVLVACGFDASRGHPYNFGGYDLSSAAYAYMTRQLMTLAHGRLVLCLEGGYKLDSICDCAEACVRALLSESHLDPITQIRESELRREPNQSAIEVLLQVSNLAMKYWPSVERWRNTVELSAIEAANMSCNRN